ncbi:hypothetical protein JTB14_020384 [Gonioctena quinquepunctata]|nr:hypothetical protein JTB14_020384 [Gonioctena quinquepunctata]
MLTDELGILYMEQTRRPINIILRCQENQNLAGTVKSGDGTRRKDDRVGEHRRSRRKTGRCERTPQGRVGDGGQQ